MPEIIYGATNKPEASKQLARYFQQEGAEISGFLYIGYPVIGTPQGRYRIDATLVSEDYGIVVFNIVEGRDLGDYKSDQDVAYNILSAKLRNYSDLTEGKRLRIEPKVVTFS
ncbi:MAG: helicase, partial [Thiohalospira sp.]